MAENEVFQQDLSHSEQSSVVFVLKLLFKEPVTMPDRETMTAVMQRHVGDIDCFWHDDKGAGFAAKKYLAEFKDAKLPPQLMVTSCTPFDGSKIDTFQRSQMWDCREDKDRILDECKYAVFANDMMAAVLSSKERAMLDMDFLEALVEMYPTCEAVLVHSSGKLLRPETVLAYQGDPMDRFINFAVNARFFNIQNSADMIVDTLGMSTVFFPDLQYHFHGMDPNWVVNHAYGVASYILANDNPIKNGDPIDSVVNGRFNQDILWKCQYEESLIQPARPVIDIFMNEYAAGNREPQ